VSYFYALLGFFGNIFSWFIGLFKKPGKAATPSEPGEELVPDELFMELHYGCPNSKRIQKLNVKRTSYK